MNIKDKDISEKIRNGDKSSFELIFNTYYYSLCNYANQIINDLETSEEIVQEMFFQLWQKKEQFIINTSLKAYLYRAIHNSCLNLIKHNKVKQAFVNNELYINSNQFYTQDDSKELITIIEKAIEKLPPERKKIFMMIRFEERRYKEVAEILSISVKTVENQMGKAMQFLREYVKEFYPIIIVLIFTYLQNILNLNR